MLWDRAAGRGFSLGRPTTDVLLVSTSADGKLAASTHYDGTVHVWDLEGRRLRAVLRGFEGLTFSSAFSPDGRWLAATGEDKTIRLWNLGSGRGRVLRGHGSRVDKITFTRDGRELLSGAVDGTVRAWDVTLGDLPEGAPATRAWLDALTSATVPDEGAEER
jgi:WD40 repeat protein